VTEAGDGMIRPYIMRRRFHYRSIKRAPN